MPLLSTFGAASARSFGGIGAAAAGAGLDIDEIFSTFLYDGTGSSQAINNGIDLSGEGGLVWTKNRDISQTHFFSDTERGATKLLSPNNSDAEETQQGLTAFNSNGFTVNNLFANNSGDDYVSWTFRKAPKFFDVIDHTQTGSEPSTVTLNHNLGCDVGMIIAKVYSHTNAWIVWHKDLGSNYVLNFDTDAASYFGGTGVSTSSTSITIPGSWVHAGYDSQNTVIYVFAHNNNDGGFGPNKDKDVIKCGSYTGNYTAFKDINLGFEPQWVLIKNTSTNSRDWLVFDNMRGAVTGGNDAWLRVDNSQPEYSNEYIEFRANGFSVADDTHVNQSGNTHIYMAIGRGPLAEPTSATDVFAIDQENSSAPYYTSNFPVDMGFIRRKDNTSSWYIYDRLRQGRELVINTTAAEGGASNAQFDYMDGFSAGAFASDVYSWMWKRAPGYFDVVAYQGTGSAGFTFNHNLGVKPEMIWVKNRGASEYWAVYHKDLNGGTNPSHYYLKLNDTNAEFNYNEIWNDTEPTATQVTVGQQGVVNSSSFSHIAYLFATVAGVSKVGSYSGTGSTQTIDCGFSNGARFVLIKCTNDAENWIVFDSVRGIVSGNDPYVALNTTDVEITSSDFIDPVSSGFAVNTNSGEVNNSSNTYIFYAIA